MDHVESFDNWDARPNPIEGSELHPLRPMSYSRRRTLSTSSRRPSIRIQRRSTVSSARSSVLRPELPSEDQYLKSVSRLKAFDINEGDDEPGGRRRSSSEPRLVRWSAPGPDASPHYAQRDYRASMVPVKEELLSQTPSRAATPLQGIDTHYLLAPPPAIPRGDSRNLWRRTSEAALHRFSRNRASTRSSPPPESQRWSEFDSRMVDILDVIDPEVAALSTLTNVQNSLFVPNLGSFVNRQPTYTISPPEPDLEEADTPRLPNGRSGSPEPSETSERPSMRPASLDRLDSVYSLSSVLGETQFAVLPEGINLQGWTKAEAQELNDHVRHMLHSRRSKFRRAMKGFLQYVSRPLGFFITFYAVSITVFGLAWVLFLIGWINVGGRQLYMINVIDNVLVALFAIMGDGLAPFRAIDTYHMIFVAHYGHLTWKIRKKRALPSLKNKNDLPSRREIDVDIEFGDTPKDEEFEFSVLSRVQQYRLAHHQKKLARSHTFYKPHETMTHYAFPLRLLIAIVVILDFHSIFQIALGACTWAIDYRVRPFALTTVILCCSITCNITGGVLIMIGDRRTRKKEVVERLFRQQLTQEAITKMGKKKEKLDKKHMAKSSVVSSSSQLYEGT